MESQNTIQRRPLDYLRIIFRRKWFIIIPAVIGIVGSIAAVNLLPRIYESSTLVLVEEGRVINPLIQGLAVSTSVSQRISTIREQILGWDRMNELIKKLNLAKEINNQEELEELVKELRNSIMVRLRGRNIISITYQGEDPEKAMNIVKTITDLFISENLRQQSTETENAIAFINDQLELYKKKLKQIEISNKEKKLNELLLDSTNKHPMVIDLKKQIETEKTELEEGNYEVEAAALGNSEAELTSLREELNNLRQAETSKFDVQDEGGNRTKLTTSTDEKLYKLLLLEKIDTIAQRDMGVNQTLYNELLKRLETAKLTQRLEASKEGTKYTILDPARLPLKPVKPNKIMVLFIGAFLGMCAGAGIVFIAEIFDHSFLGADEVKTYLDLPLLGAVSRIITGADVKAQKIRKAQVASLSILTAVILIVAIIFNVILGS